MTLDENMKNRLKELVISNLHTCYDINHARLVQTAKTSTTEGEIRSAAGNLVETLLQNIFDTINQVLPSANIQSKVGSTDFLSKSLTYKGQTLHLDSIQVDRHVWANGKRIAFIENKTYLDSCYYDRALADFRKIALSLHQHGKDPATCKFIVFAGQNAGKDETLFNYEGEFWNETLHLTSSSSGITPITFFFLKGKRQSARPWYKYKHELNDQVVCNFVELVLQIL